MAADQLACALRRQGSAHYSTTTTARMDGWIDTKRTLLLDPGHPRSLRLLADNQLEVRASVGEHGQCGNRQRKKSLPPGLLGGKRQKKLETRNGKQVVFRRNTDEANRRTSGNPSEA